MLAAIKPFRKIHVGSDELDRVQGNIKEFADSVSGNAALQAVAAKSAGASLTTSIPVQGGTLTLIASQYGVDYLIFTGTLTSALTVVFPSIVGRTWVVDFTGVTLGAFTILLKANGNTWGTSPGVGNLFRITYGGAGKLYGESLIP